jgi:plastocyanin
VDRRSLRPNVRAILLVTGLATGLASGATPGATPGARTATHEIAIAAMRFEPAIVDARVGDRIVWVNRDPFPHTVVGAPGTPHSPEIPPGGRWTFRAKVAGELPYRCSLHPTMAGTLRITK